MSREETDRVRRVIRARREAEEKGVCPNAMCGEPLEPGEGFQFVNKVVGGSVPKEFIPGVEKGLNGARDSGVIVNFSSGWGRSGASEVAPYCASKFAVEGLTASLAQELPSGLAAVALNPGVINTDMLQSCFGDGASSFPTANQWVKRAGPFIMKLDAGDNGQSLSVD